MFTFEIRARGHENISATHRTTLEVTKDREITPRGDCIIGVSADLSISEIPPEAKRLLKCGVRAEVDILLPDYGLSEHLIGFGHPSMTFTHRSDVVIRKSTFVCGRTLLISSNKAAADLSREFVRLLKDKKTEIAVVFRLDVSTETVELR